MDNVEIIEKGQNSHIERIDFNNLDSIANYGSELVIAMGDVVQNMSKIRKSDDSDSICINDKEIKSLENFSHSLENPNKNKKMIGLILDGMRDKIPFVKKKATITYFSQYEEYCKNVDKIANAVETLKNATQREVDFVYALADEAITYIPKLEDTIFYGEQDLKNFVEQIVLPLQKKYETTGSSYDQKNFELAQNTAEQVQDRLRDLREEVTMYKELILEHKLSQMVNRNLINRYEKYNRNVIPLLKHNAFSFITTKRQESKIAMQKQLVEATNRILSENAETLKKNIMDVNQLMLEGNIKIETIQDIKKNIEDSIQLIKDGYEQYKKARSKNDEIIKGINVSLERHQNSINELLISKNEEYQFLVEAPENEETHSGKGPYVLGKGNIRK